MQNSHRTNSFRLERINKLHSSKKHSQTFYQDIKEPLKLAPINSVNRSIKYNDLSFVKGMTDLNKLRKEPIQSEDSYYESAHTNLTEVRKKYDDVKKQRVQKDENITRLKQQVEKYKLIESQYLNKKIDGKKEVQYLEKQLKQKKKEFQQTVMQKKVLLNIKERVKYDKVVYDQRKYDLELEEKFIKKQLQVFSRDGTEIEEQSDRATKIYKKILREFESERIQRELHLNNLEIMIQEKISCFQANSVRENELNEIAERALQDRLYTEKQWQKILLTHMFVNKMLRNKIDKQMQKFSLVEFAFKGIKTATGVNNALEFVDKYLNKQQAYGDLLGRITINQQRISSLKQETDRLFEEQKQLQYDRQILQNTKQESSDITNEVKELNEMEKKQKSVETHFNKISQWINKQIKKFSLIQKWEEGLAIGRSIPQITEGMKKYFQLLTENLQKCQRTEFDENISEQDLNKKDSIKVARVFPKRSRKNSAGEDIFDVDEEEKNPTIQLQQGKLIDIERERILRNNEKFMQIVKRKKEEEKRLLLEKVIVEKKKAPEIKQQKQED